jgi:hypothetical protein
VCVCVCVCVCGVYARTPGLVKGFIYHTAPAKSLQITPCMKYIPGPPAHSVFIPPHKNIGWRNRDSECQSVCPSLKQTLALPEADSEWQTVSDSFVSSQIPSLLTSIYYLEPPTLLQKIERLRRMAVALPVTQKLESVAIINPVVIAYLLTAIPQYPLQFI